MKLYLQATQALEIKLEIDKKSNPSNLTFQTLIKCPTDVMGKVHESEANFHFWHYADLPNFKLKSGMVSKRCSSTVVCALVEWEIGQFFCTHFLASFTKSRTLKNRFHQINKFVATYLTLKLPCFRQNFDLHQFFLSKRKLFFERKFFLSKCSLVSNIFWIYLLKFLLI